MEAPLVVKGGEIKGKEDIRVRGEEGRKECLKEREEESRRAISLR